MTNPQSANPALHALVREILWKEWDPIGVNEFEQAADEYDAYVPRICEILRLGNAEAELRRYFAAVEDAMGLDPNPQLTDQIAKRLARAASSTLRG